MADRIELQLIRSRFDTETPSNQCLAFQLIFLVPQVTSTESNKDGTAAVNFYMSSGDGSVVPADTAAAVFDRLHPSDLSAYLGAQVQRTFCLFLSQSPGTKLRLPVNQFTSRNQGVTRLHKSVVNRND